MSLCLVKNCLEGTQWDDSVKACQSSSGGYAYDNPYDNDNGYDYIGDIGTFG